jgi:Fe-Mn family superoxide dismutase
MEPLNAKLSKRHFLGILGAAPLGMAAYKYLGDNFIPAAHAGTMVQVPPEGPFSLPKLPYAYGALSSVIDAKTMEIHHGKHHKSYVDNLNKEVNGDIALKGKSLEALLANISKYSPAVRNNAGGHWNHSFFWEIMSANKTEMPEELATAINSSFGSVEDMKKKFEEAGTKQFGSGWAWLIVNKSGKLQITSTPNQDNPLMDDAKIKGMPILGNDVWEHAYYLRYQNKRGDYLKAWWNVVNWQKVSEHFLSAG